eukprot:5829912-Prymnesium_polylepis.2
MPATRSTDADRGAPLRPADSVLGIRPGAMGGAAKALYLSLALGCDYVAACAPLRLAKAVQTNREGPQAVRARPWHEQHVERGLAVEGAS